MKQKQKQKQIRHRSAHRDRESRGAVVLVTEKILQRNCMSYFSAIVSPKTARQLRRITEIRKYIER